MPDYDVTVQVELTGITASIDLLTEEVASIKNALRSDALYSLINTLHLDFALFKADISLMQTALVAFNGNFAIFGGDSGMVAATEALDYTLQQSNLKLADIKTAGETLATQITALASTADDAATTLETLTTYTGEVSENTAPIANRLAADGSSVEVKLGELSEALVASIDELRDRLATEQHGTMTGALLAALGDMDTTLAALRDRLATEEDGTLAAVIVTAYEELNTTLAALRDRLATEEDGTLAAALTGTIIALGETLETLAGDSTEQLTAIAGALNSVVADGVPMPDEVVTAIEAIASSVEAIGERTAADGQSIGDILVQLGQVWADVPADIATIDESLAGMHQDSLDLIDAVTEAAATIESPLLYGLLETWTRDNAGKLASGLSWSSKINTSIEAFAFATTDIDIIGTTGTVTRVRQSGPVVYLPGS
jgi:signal transduction histidine kinase